MTTESLEAQSPNESSMQYSIGKIIEGPVRSSRDIGGITEHLETYRATITSVDHRGDLVEFSQSDLYASHQAIDLSVGDKAVLVSTETSDGIWEYSLVDAYRVPSLIWLALGFVILAIVLGKWKGFTSLLGLVVSTLVIVWIVVPQIVQGANPLWVSLGSSLLIATGSLFLAHGANKRTLVAYAGTVVTLLISALGAVLAVGATHLFGTGSEESLFVISDFPQINLQGLLLGGIMLGLLGVLDDITTAQSAVVDELKKANHRLTAKELYQRGISVGREHIASLINTLFLAYAGASLPLFLLFSINSGVPFYLIINNQMIAEEIVRTLIGSSALMLAVPITTAFAALAFRHKPSETGGHTAHSHN